MHDLFGDKLAAQRQAMAEGKQLADVIASEPEPAEIRFDDIADTATTGTTASPRSTTGSMVAIPQRKSNTAMYAIVGLAVAVAIGGALFFVLGRGGGEEHAGSPPGPDVALAQPEIIQAAVPDVATPDVPAPIVDAAPPPAVVTGVALFVGVPAGMKVFIDGEFAFENRGSTTADLPVPRIAAGDHTLRLDHPDYVADEFSIGFNPDERAAVQSYGEGWTVDLTKSYIRPLADGEVWVTLTVTEDGGELALNGVTVPYRANVPLKVRAKLVGGEVHITVTKRFFEPFRRAYRPVDRAAREIIVEAPIALQRAGGTGPRPDAGLPPPPPPGGTGQLRVRCEPWANVTVQGHGSRATPFTMDLPTGTYRLTFANPDQGLSGSTSVTITAGGVAKVTSCW
jgi:hypothetical protein